MTYSLLFVFLIVVEKNKIIGLFIVVLIEGCDESKVEVILVIFSNTVVCNIVVVIIVFGTFLGIVVVIVVSRQSSQYCCLR